MININLVKNRKTNSLQSLNNTTSSKNTTNNQDRNKNSFERSNRQLAFSSRTVILVMGASNDKECVSSQCMEICQVIWFMGTLLRVVMMFDRSIWQCS